MFGWEGGQRRARSRTGSALSIRLVGRGVGRRDARARGESGRRRTNRDGWIVPGVMPFQSAPAPSSRATVTIVPNIPLYLGAAPPAADAPWSCRRTFAVSSGMVHASAKEAENALAARLPMKLFRWPEEGGDMVTGRVVLAARAAR